MHLSEVRFVDGRSVKRLEHLLTAQLEYEVRNWCLNLQLLLGIDMQQEWRWAAWVIQGQYDLGVSGVRDNKHQYHMSSLSSTLTTCKILWDGGGTTMSKYIFKMPSAKFFRQFCIHAALGALHM